MHDYILYLKSSRFCSDVDQSTSMCYIILASMHAHACMDTDTQTHDCMSHCNNNNIYNTHTHTHRE